MAKFIGNTDSARGSSQWVKIIINVVRKSGMSHHEFDRYWHSQHAAVIKRVPKFTRHARRNVQCHLVVRDTPFLAAGDYDGVAELWFDDIAMMNAAFTEPRYLEVIRPDELKFVDMERTISLVTEELEIT